MKSDAGGAQGLHGGGGLGPAEHGGAGHQHVGTRPDRQRGGGGVNAAVHLQVAVRAVALNIAPDGLQLGQHVGHEGLAAEAGLHRHHQNQVQPALQIGDHRLGGGDGPEDDALLYPALLHPVQGAVDGGGEVGLQMDGEQVCPRLGKGANIPLRLFNHQVYVQKLAGAGAQGLDHRHADGNVGDKHAVHHVHVEPVGVGDPLNVPLKIGKIR